MTVTARLWRGRDDDGVEYLVTAWPTDDGKLDVAEVAVRRPRERTWGPPVELVEES